MVNGLVRKITMHAGTNIHRAAEQVPEHAIVHLPGRVRALIVVTIGSTLGSELRKPWKLVAISGYNTRHCVARHWMMISWRYKYSKMDVVSLLLVIVAPFLARGNVVRPRAKEESVQVNMLWLGQMRCGAGEA